MDLDELARKVGVVFDDLGMAPCYRSELRALVNEALEEAARKCDGMSQSDWSPGQCADAIRSLKLK